MSDSPNGAPQNYLGIALAKEALKVRPFGDVYPLVAEADREELRRFFCFEFDARAARNWTPPSPPPVTITAGPDVKTLPPSGNPCRKCGAGMVRGGKCQYCPFGCGSEGECS